MKFWLAVFIVLLIILDIIWMLDGFLNVQYGQLLSNESSLNSTMTMALNLFGDKPLVSLYYRIIITLLVIVIGIILTFLFNKISKYRAELDLSNYKYKSLFMEMKTGFALRRIFYDAEGNIEEIRFIEVNPAFKLHTGLDNSDITNKTIEEVFGHDNQELIREYDRIARSGGSFTKVHYSKKNNKILRITAYQHEENVFATIVEDITKEQRYEDELKESAQLKDILLNNVSESVFYIDRDMRVLWANEKAVELAKKQDANIIGMKCYELWCGKKSSCLKCPARKSLSTREVQTDEIKNKFGRYLQITSNPLFTNEKEIKGIVVTVTDLTEWIQTIEDLKYKRTQLNLTLEVGQMTTWFWESESEKVKLELSNVFNDTGKNSWQLADLHRYIKSDDRNEFLRQKELVLKGETQEMKLEVRILNPQREWTWYNILGQVQESDENGKPIKMVGITYNIDGLKRTNEELKRLKEELETEVKNRLNELREKDLVMIRQSRQAAMGEMIGNIAHQWRQPLNSIAVIIQDMVDAWDFEELTREYLIDRVNLGMSILNHMSNTIDDFRDFFLPDKKPSEFRLDEQIYKTIKILNDMYKSQGIKIITDMESISINSYSREFSQVVINILNNAKDAIIETETAEPYIDIKLYRSQENIVLKIKDNAGGIDEKIMDKIFDPYFTTKHKSSGTGVGLYMSKNIIEKHLKGALTAKNTREGAEFTIQLPANENA